MQIVYRHPPSTGLYCVIGRGPLRPFLASVSPADLPIFDLDRPCLRKQ